MYLLDDPLAAVDAHVAQHLFDQCIMGLLQNTTRILATHHTRFLHQADVILVMDHGQIIKCGEKFCFFDSEIVFYWRFSSAFECKTSVLFCFI